MKTRINFAVLFVVALLASSQNLFAAWPFNTNVSQGAYVSPTIGDIDGDGVLDVLIVAQNHILYCLTPNGDMKWSKNLYDDTDPQPPFYSAWSSSATLADIDGDPNTLEILVGSGGGTNPNYWGRLYAINSQGAELARFNVPLLIWSSPTVADADQDGQKEVYFPISGKVYAVNVVNNGGVISFSQKWVYQSGLEQPTVITASNVTGDGKLELIFSEVYSSKIHCLNSQGQLIWTSPSLVIDGGSSAVVADLDADGTMEVVQRDRAGRVSCLNASNGSIKWQYTVQSLSFGPANTPSVVDLNGDGKLEIVFGQYTEIRNPFLQTAGYLQCLTFDGQLCSNWDRTPLPGSYATGSAAIVKNPADNSINVYIGSSDGLTAYNSTGARIWMTGLGSANFVSVAAADLDQNGDIELCYGSYNGRYECRNHDGSVFQYTSPGAAPFDPKPWPKIHQNNQNTGFYQLLPVPQYTLTVNIIGNGTVTRTPDQPTYSAANPPQVIQLTAQPATRWLFDHWSGDLSGTQNPITIAMDGNKTVMATFKSRLQPAPGPYLANPTTENPG